MYGSPFWIWIHTIHKTEKPRKFGGWSRGPPQFESGIVTIIPVLHYTILPNNLTLLAPYIIHYTCWCAPISAMRHTRTYLSTALKKNSAWTRDEHTFPVKNKNYYKSTVGNSYVKLTFIGLFPTLCNSFIHPSLGPKPGGLCETDTYSPTSRQDLNAVFYQFRRLPAHVCRFFYH